MFVLCWLFVVQVVQHASRVTGIGHLAFFHYMARTLYCNMCWEPPVAILCAALVSRQPPWFTMASCVRFLLWDSTFGENAERMLEPGQVHEGGIDCQESYGTFCHDDCVPAKDFVAEETSRVTLKHITELMSCNYKWASIALVAQLSTESELVANWSEGCSCKDHYGQCFLSEPTGEGSPCCPFKGCRAPELACGVALALQTCKVRSNRAVFNEYVSKAPEAKRSELYNTWSKGSGKIWGASVWTRIVSLWSFICEWHLWMTLRW